MRLFLCGKGEGAEAILRQMREAGDSAAVFTTDERLAALADELDVTRTEASVNQWHLWPWKPKLIVSIGYLDILTPAVLERAPAINCHYALLPKRRGRSCVPWAILSGDALTGVTWHWIDSGIDTGHILMQATCQIGEDETQASLFGKLHRLAAETWPAALMLAHSGFPGLPQCGQSQYHRAGPPHGGVIDPTWPAEYVERFIRAMTYPPLPCATWDGMEVKTLADYVAMRWAAQWQDA